jgi:hypothetical protein
LAAFVLSVVCLTSAAVIVCRNFWPTRPTTGPTQGGIPWIESDAARTAGLSDKTPREELKKIAAATEQPPDVRVRAIYFLSQANDWNSIELLIGLLDDTSPLVRGRASVAIQHILGTDFYYRAEDDRPQRLKAIDGIRRYWQGRNQNPPQ